MPPAATQQLDGHGTPGEVGQIEFQGIRVRGDPHVGERQRLRAAGGRSEVSRALRPTGLDVLDDEPACAVQM
jgi:hypothetical protein